MNQNESTSESANGSAPERILERVRKLLAMAGDTSSPHEAAIAARRARALMAKYQLEHADVVLDELGDADNFATKPTGREFRRRPLWFNFLIVGIAEATETRACWWGLPGIGWQGCFSGYQPDVELAGFLLDYLADQIEQLAAVHREGQRQRPSFTYRKHPRTHMKDYREGLTIGVCDRLSEFYADGAADLAGTANALTIAKRNAVDREFGQQKTDAVERDPYSINAFATGREDAERVNVARGLESETSTPAGPVLLSHGSAR